AEDGIRDLIVTGVQTCALPILRRQGPLQPGPPVAPREDQAHRGKGPLPGGCRARPRPRDPGGSELRQRGPRDEGAASRGRHRGRSEERRVGKEWRVRWVWTGSE